MSTNVALLRRHDSSQPRGIAPPPRHFSTTWTTLLEPPPSFAPRDDSRASSWEPRVFAEDACSLLCGGSWPPRSYSCSFCKREFKSAQALGGHMNVHRRDRARLRQRSPSATDSASLTLEPDLRSPNISQDTDQQSMRFGYPAQRDASFSSSLASPSLWHSVPTSKPSIVSPPLDACSSVLLHRSSFEDRPRDGSCLPGFAARLSHSTSKFARQSMDSWPPALSSTEVFAFPDRGSNPGTAFDTGKSIGVSSSLLQLKSESSRKRSVTPVGFQPYQSLSVKNLDGVHLPRLRSEDRENDDAVADNLDLELRLGQKS